MKRVQQWHQWMNPQRLGGVHEELSSAAGRSPFDRDHDRIIFSSAFRRLKDKTQVFPLSPSDYTRTRLTHTIEVASVGRSLGLLAARHLFDDLNLKRENNFTEVDFGAVVSNACLIHDSGNPPFGHAGEKAIQEWAQKKFKTDNKEKWLNDLRYFEGNAQSFRIYTRLQAREQDGGLRLTFATLGTLMKYPLGVNVFLEDKSRQENSSNGQGKVAKPYSKFGFFQTEENLARQVFVALGMRELTLGHWQRHPLAYLMEAADDICNTVVDLEDAARMGVLSANEVQHLLAMITGSLNLRGSHPSPDELVNRYRARAISALIQECVEVFKSNLAAIESGAFESDLISLTKYKDAIKEIALIANDRIFLDKRVLETEIVGFKAIGGLLSLLTDAFLDRPNDASSKKVRRLLQSSGHPDAHAFDAARFPSNQQKLMQISDYISGMTDGYAVDLYQRLTGIRL